MTTFIEGEARTDVTEFPPASATITITGAFGSTDVDAPANLLDLTVESLESKIGPDMARAIVSVGRKLYVHGSVDLGYGTRASITGQN